MGWGRQRGYNGDVDREGKRLARNETMKEEQGREKSTQRRGRVGGRMLCVVEISLHK